MRRFVLVIPMLLVFTAACSLADDSKPAVKIGDAELQAMAEAFTNATFGDEYANMVLDDESGIQTKQAFIDEADDPEDEAKDVERFGYVSSYENGYTYAGAQAKGGTIIAGVSVTMFSSENGATGYLRDDLDEGRRSFSGTTEAGTLLAFETFKPKVGKENYGVFIQLKANKDTFGTDGDVGFTVVTFRRGKVLGSVFILRADAKDAKAVAMKVAKQLDAQIQAVMRGDKPVAPAAVEKQ
jgi:hypothetical protein